MTRDSSSGDTSILEPNAQNELLIAVAAGDGNAFATLFHHFAPRVKALLIRAGAQAEVANEIVQEVQMTIWRICGVYNPARASAAAWIFTIARDRRIDLLRHKQQPEIDHERSGNCLRNADPAGC